MPTFRIGRAALIGLTALSLLAAACGDDGDSDAAATENDDTSDESSSTMAPEAETDADAASMLTEENFGDGCAAVPSDGAGSFQGMAMDPAATAASNNPELSTLTAAVTAADLVDTLNGPGPFTIFAPSNGAFEKVPAATMEALLADPGGDLTSILTYHVIGGQQLDAQQLADAGSEATVNGAEVEVAEAGDTIEINGESAVVCGNVATANGTVHIIDTVLMPPG